MTEKQLKMSFDPQTIERRSFQAPSKARGLATVVMFILLPQVMLKKRLDVDGAMQRWRDKIPQLILQNFTETSDAER